MVVLTVPFDVLVFWIAVVAFAVAVAAGMSVQSLAERLRVLDELDATIAALAREVRQGLAIARPGSRKKEWKSETECGAVLHELFPGCVFLKNQRPAWNKNPTTGRALELDWYCEALKLAVEYQGEQHYKTVERFDGPDQKAADGKLAVRQARDLLTDANCATRGVHLVCVPYTHKTRIREFLLADAGVCRILAARPK